MSAQFTLASSQYLVNAAPRVTGYPFTVGLWYRHEALTAVVQTIWCLADTATTNNYFVVDLAAAETLRAGAAAGGTQNNALLTSGAVVARKWLFVVARFITSTNRRISAYYSDTGLVEHGNTTTSRAPTGIDTMTIGALKTSTVSLPLGGCVAEYWLANADIQLDGLALTDATLLQLAFRGPFSMPNIPPSLIEYRTFRTDPILADSIGDYAPVAQTWTNTNGVTVSDHPPLPYEYVRPGQAKQQLVV